MIAAPAGTSLYDKRTRAGRAWTSREPIPDSGVWRANDADIYAEGTNDYITHHYRGRGEGGG